MNCFFSKTSRNSFTPKSCLQKPCVVKTKEKNQQALRCGKQVKDPETIQKFLDIILRLNVEIVATIDQKNLWS